MPPGPRPARRCICGARSWASTAWRTRPWVNHSWHATLYVTPRGLTTGPVPDAGLGSVTLTFDLRKHALVVEAEDDRRAGFPLEPMSVADFLARTQGAVTGLGGAFVIHGRPNEVPDPVPFAEDMAERPYDAEAVERFHRALLRIVPVMERFRTGFPGQGEPRAPVLGLVRPRRDALLGEAGAAPPGRVPGPARCGDARGLQPRGLVRGLLAWEQRRGRGDVLRLRLSLARGLLGPPPWSPRPRAGTRAWASSCCPTRPCARAPTPRRRCCGSSRAPTRPRPRRAAGTVAALECALGRPGVPRAVHAGGVRWPACAQRSSIQRRAGASKPLSAAWTSQPMGVRP